VIFGSSAIFFPLFGHYFVVYEVFYILILVNLKEGRQHTVEGETGERKNVMHWSIYL
jgi:hypothetical protein